MPDEALEQPRVLATLGPSTLSLGSLGGRVGRIGKSNSAGRPVSLARIRAAAWGVFLLALTSWPSPPTVPLISAIPEVDMHTHFLLYAVEAFFLYRAVAWPGRPGFSAGRVLTIVGTLAVWGTVDEVHQVWIPGRGMEASDLAADLAGAFVGAVVASLVSRGRKRTRGLPVSA